MPAGQRRGRNSGARYCRPFQSAAHRLHARLVFAERSGRCGAEPAENQSRTTFVQCAPDSAARAAPGWPSASHMFFERGFPNARVRVTTDLEIAFEAAFGAGEGILLLAGTGSAAFGRDANGRTARAGGRGPWFSDEGSAFDIGRRAFAAVSARRRASRPCDGALQAASRLAPVAATGIRCSTASPRIPTTFFRRHFRWSRNWPIKSDAVCREILSGAAASLVRARRVRAQANSAGATGKCASPKWAASTAARNISTPAIESELKKVMPAARLVSLEISPAEAAVQMAIRRVARKGKCRLKPNIRSSARGPHPATSLKPLVHDQRRGCLLAVLENPHCEEPHVTLLLERLDLPANVIDRRRRSAEMDVERRRAFAPRLPSAHAQANRPGDCCASFTCSIWCV